MSTCNHCGKQLTGRQGKNQNGNRRRYCNRGCFKAWRWMNWLKSKEAKRHEEGKAAIGAQGV